MVEVKINNKVTSRRKCDAPMPSPPRLNPATPVNPMARTVYSKFYEKKFEFSTDKKAERPK